MTFSIDDVTTAIAATGALGAASMGLVDASKAVAGGVARLGFGHVLKGCAPFTELMQRGAGGADWIALLEAHWRDGRARETQIGLARTLVRLGLGAAGPIPPLAGIGVEAQRIDRLAARLRAGDTPDDDDAQTLARIDAVIGLRIEAAYMRADQQYRNTTRAIAGAIALALAVGVGAVIGVAPWRAAIIGLVAVPLAPLAKDLVSSLSAAAIAVKAARRGV